jgi:DraK Histidine Kinase N-terminal domain
LRRRLLISTLLVAVTAVLLLGVPLAIVMTRLVRDEAVRQLQRDATTVATALRYRANHHQLADYHEFRESLPGDYITIRQKGHPTEIIGQRPPRHQLITGQDADGNITVTVQSSSSSVNGRVAGALVLVGALSLLARLR